MADIFAKLANPLPPAKVSWRVGQITKKDPKKASAFAYIDARDVMARLDEVIGPENWQDHYEETVRGRIICTIDIMVRGQWVSKSDGAGDTAVEGEKGALSDAFKRAAVKWGIGRYLYDIPMQWVQIDEWKQIIKSELPRLQKVLPGSVIYTEDGSAAPPASPTDKKTEKTPQEKKPETPFDEPSKQEEDISDWPAFIEGFKRDFIAAGTYLLAQEYWSTQSKTLKELKMARPSAYSSLVSWAKTEGDKLPKEAS